MSIIKIATIGDSITHTDPTRSTHTLGHYLEGLLGPGYCVGDQAIAGWLVAQVKTLCDTNVIGKGYHAACILAGINDFRDTANVAATQFVDYQAMVVALKADGVKVICSSTLQWKDFATSWTSARQAQVDAFNLLIRNWCAANGETFIDNYADFASVADVNVMKDEYGFSDGGTGYLHPNGTGTLRLATNYYNAIRARGL
jgi:hypothetical protein